MRSKSSHEQWLLLSFLKREKFIKRLIRHSWTTHGGPDVADKYAKGEDVTRNQGRVEGMQQKLKWSAWTPEIWITKKPAEVRTKLAPTF